MIHELHLKRGARRAWIQGRPASGVAARVTWDRIIDEMVRTGAIDVHDDESVERITVSDSGVTFYIDDTSR